MESDLCGGDSDGSRKTHSLNFTYWRPKENDPLHICTGKNKLKRSSIYIIGLGFFLSSFLELSPNLKKGIITGVAYEELNFAEI